MAIQYGGPSIGAAHIPFTAPKSPPIRRPPPPVLPPVRHPSLTAPQVANQQVNQALAPQITAQNAFNQRQNQAITAFANALLGKLTPLAGQVGQTYDQAIGQTAALSNQSAQFLQNANPSPQVQALLQSAGAPQAQQDQLTQALGGTFGGGAGVLSFLGGAVPGGQLAADKAAAVGQTAQLPGIAALQGEQSLASALGTQADARNKLLATRPGLYQTALQNIRTNQSARAKLAQAAQQNQIANRFKATALNQTERQNAATDRLAVTRLDQQGRQDTAANTLKAATIGERAREYGTTQAEKQRQFNLTLGEKQRQFNTTAAQKKAASDFLQWYRTKGINLSEAKVNQAATEFGITAQQKQQQIAVSQQNANTAVTRANNAATKQNAALKPRFSGSVSRALGYRADQYGSPVGKVTLLPGFAYDKTGNIVKAPSASAAKSATHGLTVNQVNHIKGLALQGAEAFKKGWTDKDGVHAPESYQAALLDGQKQGIPLWILIPALNRFYTLQERPPSPANAAKYYRQTAPKVSAATQAKQDKGAPRAAAVLKQAGLGA